MNDKSRIVESSVIDDNGAEAVVESSFRPQNFDDFVGQQQMCENLQVFVFGILFSKKK